MTPVTAVFEDPAKTLGDRELLFRSDTPEHIRSSLSAALLARPDLCKAFSFDLKSFDYSSPEDETVIPDVASHIGGHVWTFAREIGVPSFDLGIAFWKGGDELNLCRAALIRDWDKSQPDGTVLSIPPELKDSYRQQYAATMRFLDTLEGLDRGLSAPEYMELDPQPDAFLDKGEAAFSFFRYYLPFMVEGETRYQTYERRTHYFVDLIDSALRETQDPAQRAELASLLPNLPDTERWKEAKTLVAAWKNHPSISIDPLPS